MRATVTTDAEALVAHEATSAERQEYSDALTRSFVILSPTRTGTVLVKPGPASGPAPDMDDAARWDFSQAMLTYTLEPGRALYAATAAGTVDLDILEGGER